MFTLPANAVILFFKAEQFGLFGATSTVSGYVNPKGKFVAPYQGTRHHALKKPKHPLSGHLFADQAQPTTHVQPEPETTTTVTRKPAKPRPPKPLSPEKLEALRAKVKQILAHAKVDAQHAPQHGNAHRKLYLAQLADLTGLPGDELMTAQQEVDALFTPKVAAEKKPEPDKKRQGIPPLPERIKQEKEPWQMTAEEYAIAKKRDVIQLLNHLGMTEAAQKVAAAKNRTALTDTEYYWLRYEAQAAGKPVPDHTMIDYPDLKPKAETQKEPWEMTQDEYVAQHVKANPIPNTATAGEAKAVTGAARKAWKQALADRAKQGRVSDVALDDYLKRFGAPDFMRTFGGDRLPGIEGYSGIDIEAMRPKAPDAAKVAELNKLDNRALMAEANRRSLQMLTYANDPNRSFVGKVAEKLEIQSHEEFDQDTKKDWIVVAGTRYKKPRDALIAVLALADKTPAQEPEKEQTHKSFPASAQILFLKAA